MNSKRAREILQSLIQGVDPTTGSELPARGPLHDAVVLRALLAGVQALGDTMSREQRRAELPGNSGKSWSTHENADLIDAFQTRTPLADIATKHGRTLRAIEARLEKLGLITAAERSTADRF